MIFPYSCVPISTPFFPKHIVDHSVKKVYKMY